MLAKDSKVIWSSQSFAAKSSWKKLFLNHQQLIENSSELSDPWPWESPTVIQNREAIYIYQHQPAMNHGLGPRPPLDLRSDLAASSPIRGCTLVSTSLSKGLGWVAKALTNFPFNYWCFKNNFFYNTILIWSRDHDIAPVSWTFCRTLQRAPVQQSRPTNTCRDSWRN